MKKGDKVKVYGGIIDFSKSPVETYFLRGDLAKVIYSFAGFDEIEVKFYGTPGHRLQKGTIVSVHPKQCRLVRKK